MSRSKLESMDLRFSNRDHKHIKFSPDIDSLDNIEIARKRRMAPYEPQNIITDDSHYDQQYSAFAQNSDKLPGSSFSRRLMDLEDKMASIDYVTKQNSMFELKLEDLALQFEKFLSSPNDRGKGYNSFNESLTQGLENRVKLVEDRCDMMNSKLDKGLLILSRDIQNFERANQHNIRELIEHIVGPSLQDLGEAIKFQSLDLEEMRQQTQQHIKQSQRDILGKIHALGDSNQNHNQSHFQRTEYSTPEPSFSYKKQSQASNEQFKIQSKTENHNIEKRSQKKDQTRPKYIDTTEKNEQQYFKGSRNRDEQEKQIDRDRLVDYQQSSHQNKNSMTMNHSNSAAPHNMKGNQQPESSKVQTSLEQHRNQSFVDDDQVDKQRTYVPSAQNEYDETRKKIDEEINRRLMEENEKRRNTISKENEYQKGDKQDQVRLKRTPMSTEKSRAKEIQNRLHLERKTKQEKINQLNEHSLYRKK